MMGADERTSEQLSRGEMLAKSALAVGALYGLNAVAPFVQRTLAASGGSDIDILNFILPFEYLQASIYNRGNSEINDKGEKMSLDPKEKELVETLFEEEGQHVAAVRSMVEQLGGKPVEKGGYAFAFREFATLLRLAGMLESAAIGAYNGAIPRLKSREAQELAASIVQVEGRHAARLLVDSGEEPEYTPYSAFDFGATERSALIPVEQFIGPSVYELPAYK